MEGSYKNGAFERDEPPTTDATAMNEIDLRDAEMRRSAADTKRVTFDDALDIIG